MKCSAKVILAVFASISTFLPPVSSFSVLSSARKLPLSRSLLGAGGSRLEGNSREPSSEELQIMDEMITKLADAKPYELPNAVRRAFRVISSPQFFMRIAERSDTEDETERKKLAALASNLATTLEAVVETTEEQLDERAQQVEDVVKAAAEPDSGEFMVPLLPERIDAMRAKLEGLEESCLDEGFLNTVDTWMMKTQQDGMDLMVNVLQKVLQIYAGTQIGRALARQEIQDQTGGVFETLLTTDSDSWDAVLLQNEDDIDAVQKQTMRVMENLVLSLDAGSLAQRVQAEYLKELVSRVEAVQQKTSN